MKPINTTAIIGIGLTKSRDTSYLLHEKPADRTNEDDVSFKEFQNQTTCFYREFKKEITAQYSFNMYCRVCLRDRNSQFNLGVSLYHLIGVSQT